MPDHTQRFGLVMDYVARFEGAPEGILLSNTFWCVDGDMVISPSTKIIRLWYRGWESVAKYNAGFPPIPGAERVYQFDGPLFDEAIMTPTTLATGTPIAAELMTMINSRAFATKDMHVEDGEPVSFFENAVAAT